MTRRTIITLALLICTQQVLLTAAAYADWELDLESGLVAAGYNDVRIPNVGGTLISLTDDLESDSKLFWRARLTYYFSERHVISLLGAPLRLEANGRVDNIVSFEGVDFPAQTALAATYRFDSYRLTYRYLVHSADRLRLGLGFTAKIRDAEVTLQSEDLISTSTNTGFVPLINFELRWLFHRQLELLFAGDALAAPQGRAEDVILALQYQPAPRLGLRAGYRLLEGGADVDDVYTFALLHYLVLGAQVRF